MVQELRCPQELRKQWKRWLTKRQAPVDWRPLGLWNLATVNCWTGGPAQYFVDRLPGALGGDIPIRDVGITASEGFFAIPLHSSWRGGVAWVGGHFMELACEETGQVIPIYEGEVGRVYRIILSTTAGLYRYDIKDLVEVVGRYGRTPVLRFVGKCDDVSSVLGEKITPAQVSLAMARVLPEQYSGDACVSVQMAEVPRYVLSIEGDIPNAWVQAFDAALGSLNVEYASKRESGRLGQVVGLSLPKGTFRRVREEKMRSGGVDGQVKDPILVGYETVLAWMENVVQDV